MNICVFCSEPLTAEKIVPLGLKGVININKISEVRSDGIEVEVGQIVHERCRKNYTRPTSKVVDEATSTENAVATPTAITNETNLQLCIFCGKPAKFTENRKRGIETYQVRNDNFETKILKCILERNDKWAHEVDARIGTSNLLTIGATYHQSCSVRFRTNKECTPTYSGKKMERPQNQSRDVAFLKICEYMKQHEGEVFSVSELSDRMDRECGEESAAYTNKYLKSRLLQYFGKNIVISQMCGSKDLVLFRYSVDHIISDFYQEKRNMNSQEEKKRIMQSASKLVLSEIFSIDSSKDEYPHPDELSNIENQYSFVPNLLSEFLAGIIKSTNRDIKIASIGQAIIQAARPRAIIAPMQIGLGVQLHHLFGSKFLVQILYILGFCSSYAEIKRFELCAAASGEDVNIENNVNKVKFAADNVDHDTRTLDGKNTFHGMGIIAAFTPAHSKKKAVKRVKASIEDVRSIGTIEILPYEGNHTENNLTYEIVPDFCCTDVCDKTDFLLSTAWGNSGRGPSWSGLMQLINHGTHSGKSSITILPLINLNPSDFTCINSTLHFVTIQANRYNVEPILTFDQPLYWKSQIIIANEAVSSPLKNITLLLGGFHTLMSFMGCIGNFMDELGLQETLETVYASNSVTHMLTGKAYSRALRGHFLVDNALNTLISRDVAPQVLTDGTDWSKMLTDIDELYDKLINENIGMEELISSSVLNLAKEKIENVKQRLGNNFRTARLWLQYTDMVQVLRSFLRSERTGNWKLHLATIQKMLPYFAAAGHNFYAKCCYIYLQQMAKLKDTQPNVYNILSNGDFIIRTTERYWSGKACDLTIEQTLMRNIKSQIGLTRGRGMDENQRLIWVQSMPDCVEFNNAMQDLTQVRYETSEQHKDCGATRQKRDHKDYERIFDFLKERNPFQQEDPALRNICNGMQADSKVNVDDAAAIGKKIISSMTGQNVSSYTFKKANSVVKMSTKNLILIDGDIVKIDPQLLFQRLVLIMKNMDDDKIQNVFKYELTQKPSALFDDLGFMREETNSNSLDDALWNIVGGNMDNAPHLHNCHYILEGNSLINQIAWQKNETFDDICLKYVSHVAQYDSPTVVFNSSDTVPSIKDEIHVRRTKGIPGRDISFTGDMTLNCKKESFLSNQFNMQRFINMLGKVLSENNCKVIYASDNPVTIISQSAVEATRDTVVVGEDTSILVVLCHYFAKTCHNIWFKKDGKNSKSSKLWNIRKMDEILGEPSMKCLLFIHAVLGSEGTSHLFGLGKATALKKFRDVKDFRDLAEVFLNHRSNIADIIDAGNKALCILYNGKTIQNLNVLRYQRFCEKVSTKTTAVLVQSLPPTEAAAKYHSLRTYFQIQAWLAERKLDPLEFGWELKGNLLRAKTTDLEPAPAELLSSIRCNCKGNCDTKRCNCKKHVLKCSTACGNCKGSNCLNSYSEIIIDEDDCEDDDLPSEV